MNIIIIDDEPKIRKGLEKLINESFHQKHSVYSFEHAKPALEFLKSHKADLVITDIRMPDISGLELIREIRHSDKQVEIVILSGVSDFTFAQQAIDLKVSKYFTKPSDPDELVAFIDSYDKIRNETEALPASYTGNNMTIIKCINYILRNYHNKFTLNEIAEELYITPTYLCKLFKKETGRNLSDFVMEFRMKKAKELLGQLELSLTEIADRVGYHDTGYFSSTFKKFYGITPHEYRNLH